MNTPTKAAPNALDFSIRIPFRAFAQNSLLELPDRNDATTRIGAYLSDAQAHSRHSRQKFPRGSLPEHTELPVFAYSCQVRISRLCVLNFEALCLYVFVCMILLCFLASPARWRESQLFGGVDEKASAVPAGPDEGPRSCSSCGRSTSIFASFGPDGRAAFETG